MPAKRLVKRSPSVLKRQRQSAKKREQNNAFKSKVKTLIKKVRAAIDEKNIDAAKVAMKNAESALAKAATKGVLHKRNASRRTSRLAAHVSDLGKK